MIHIVIPTLLRGSSRIEDDIVHGGVESYSDFSVFSIESRSNASESLCSLSLLQSCAGVKHKTHIHTVVQQFNQYNEWSKALVRSEGSVIERGDLFLAQQPITQILCPIYTVNV